MLKSQFSVNLLVSSSVSQSITQLVSQSDSQLMSVSSLVSEVVSRSVSSLASGLVSWSICKCWDSPRSRGGWRRINFVKRCVFSGLIGASVARSTESQNNAVDNICNVFAKFALHGHLFGKQQNACQ